MLKPFFCTAFWLVLSSAAVAQKKPLDHSVYDEWQSIGERMVSNNGKWIVYSVNPQEGDNQLIIQSSSDIEWKKVIPRGSGAVITNDSRFLVCRIKPYFASIREARIKKKKPEDFPKDSLAILDLEKGSLFVTARVKSFTTPQKGSGWVAYLREQPVPARKQPGGAADQKKMDSLQQTIDSLTRLLQAQEAAQPSKKKKRRSKGDALVDLFAADDDAAGDEPEGTQGGNDLVLRRLHTGEEMVFPGVRSYLFSKDGHNLLLQTTPKPKDSLDVPAIILVATSRGTADTIAKGGSDFRNFAFSDDGIQLAFIAERDSAAGALQKFYKLWYFKEGMDTAMLLADKNSVGMELGMTVSENGAVQFSKSGRRLFFGVAPIQPPKDTSLVELDEVKLDIWHYNDDYLQPVQLKRLQQNLRENFLTVYDLAQHTITQLESKQLPNVRQTDEGDGSVFLGLTNVGKRIASQWTGRTLNDVYAVDIPSGKKELVKENLDGTAYPSTTGKYIIWYDDASRNYFSWDGEQTRNITAGIPEPLYNEENDVPDDPRPYGIMGWQQYDEAVFIYDRYDVWKVDPSGQAAPVNITRGMGRKVKTRYRYIQLDREERFIKPSQDILLETFHEVNKHEGIARMRLTTDDPPELMFGGAFALGRPMKSDSADVYIYTKENYTQPPDLYVSDHFLFERKLSHLNPQQDQYLWGTASLYKWKTFDGKNAEGILYKPENFNATRKYPMIIYFYERLSDRLYQYLPPAPTPSRLDITFFVSRGYLVFTPDIHYGTGHPGKDAYNYVVSGAQSLAKEPWVDGKNIGIQGQSWGGYQVAYLITATNMFKAAWAGAPVANMTSAYGGIRWGSGLNRQFQYERTQSRIGATLWEKPELYIENSPLFHLTSVQTPLVIMHNDQDGSVPWYQGIELFTAMRRLGKKVWLLDYNGEDHNLVQRKNRKDLSIREQQYFDWMLKGANPPKWLTEGVPAVEKGKDRGLEIIDQGLY